MSLDTVPVAFITGAAHRVGAVLARELHRSGYRVVIHYLRSERAATELCQDLNRQRERSAAVLRGDVLDPNAIAALAAQAVACFGRLDVLINNASSFYPTPVGSITLEQWDDLIGTNVRAPLLLSQALVPALRATTGAIINIADIHADRPLKNHTVYCVAKAGLVMLTKSLARELAPDVRVNAIAPGAILWPEQGDAQQQEHILSRIALKRQGTPLDIAKAALYLARDADYVTGQIITVDGGRTLSN